MEREGEGEFCDESEMSVGATSFERKDVETPVAGTKRNSWRTKSSPFNCLAFAFICCCLIFFCFFVAAVKPEFLDFAGLIVYPGGG